LAAAVIVIAGLAAYSDSFSGPFVFDDRAFLDQPTAQNLWPIGPALAAPRPVAQFTLALNHSLGGGVWGYHAFNLAVHLLAALTLFGIVRRTLTLPLLAPRFGRASTALAFCLALLWALNPLQTEAVTYVIQRMELLMGLFYLLTLYCFIRATSSPELDGLNYQDAKLARPPCGGTPRTATDFSALRVLVSWWSKRWYLAAVLACALGMGSKEVMVTAPVLVLLYDKTFIAGSFREALRRRWGFYLALSATWAILAGRIAEAFAPHAESAGFHLSNLTPFVYARSELGVILHYLRLAFWPGGLCLDYDWPVAKTAGQILPGAVVVGGLLAATAWALLRRPMWGFIGAWFFLTLAPTSSFMPVKDLAFEHRMYLPLAGVISAAVFAACLAGKRLAPRLERTPEAQRRPKWLSIGLAAAVVLTAAAALGWLTFLRNEVYRNGTSLWEDTISKSRNNVRAWSSLGWELRRARKYDEAIRCLCQAIQLNPDYAMAYNNRAAVYADTHRFAEAVQDYDKAIALRGAFAPAYNDRAAACIRLGRYEQAVRDCDTAIRLKPDYAVAYNNRAAACFALRRYPQALSDSEKAIALKPDYAEAYWIRGNVFKFANRPDEAVQNYATAIALKPDYADAYTNRAVAYYDLKEFGKAWADVKKSQEHGGRPSPDFLKALAQVTGRLE